jgi:sulfate adenylyltransferase/3'-phosphoadenosine 5'-phosphosulfate synthase
MSTGAGFVVWFTGLSGAGKSTLGAMLAAALRQRGVHVEVLDGDEVRTHLSKGLSFSREDRDTNVRRIGYVAKLVARSGACAITAAISPYRSIREEQRTQIGRFVEVYVRCSIAVLAERDVKGLYKKALAGEIKHFTGVDDPYEEPENPEVVIDTAVESREEGLARILHKLEELGYIGAGPGAPARAGRTLIAPHGGELVDRIAKGAERARLVEALPSLAAVDLDERAERDLEMIAVGAFSPLKGFMGPKDYLRVVREMRLENGLVWPLPITLSASPEVAARLSPGSRAALRARDGRLVAALDVTDVWTPDKAMEARAVYGTEDVDHPGVAALHASGPVYVGGEVHLVDRPLAPAFPAHHRDPREVRDILVDRGFARVVGYHPDGVMHRTHEYVTKVALETCDGLLVHPSLDGGDLPAEVRIRCYEALLVGYYPKDRALLSVYPAAARHAGARETLLHALVRKSYGCSHFIVEGARAGDARRILEEFLPGEIGVELLTFADAYWSLTVGGVATAKTAPDEQAHWKHDPARDLVREMLARGEVPPPVLSRPEVVRILVEANRR